MSYLHIRPGRSSRPMTEDVLREGNLEIVVSPEAKRAIGTRTARLYKEHLAQLRFARACDGNSPRIEGR